MRPHVLSFFSHVLSFFPYVIISRPFGVSFLELISIFHKVGRKIWLDATVWYSIAYKNGCIFSISNRHSHCLYLDNSQALKMPILVRKYFTPRASGKVISSFGQLNELGSLWVFLKNEYTKTEWGGEMV